jgi:hypothetical protein
LAFEVVEPLLVGFGDVCQAVDELEGFRKPGGGFGGAGVAFCSRSRCRVVSSSSDCARAWSHYLCP